LKSSSIESVSAQAAPALELQQPPQQTEQQKQPQQSQGELSPSRQQNQQVHPTSGGGNRGPSPRVVQPYTGPRPVVAAAASQKPTAASQKPASSRSGQPLEEFDFSVVNTNFGREQLASMIKTAESEPGGEAAAASLSGHLAQIKLAGVASYDKAKSFYDDLSTETIGQSRSGRQNDLETFGQEASSYSGGRGRRGVYGRGRGRGNRRY
jgi:hypothetical protein